MPKFLSAFLFLVLFITLQSQLFAQPLSCKVLNSGITGIQSIQVRDESLFINENLEIPLSKSKVRCGHLKGQTRLDGNALGYQVILKTCSSKGLIEGNLIDSVHAKVADVVCN